MGHFNLSKNDKCPGERPSSKFERRAAAPNSETAALALKPGIQAMQTFSFEAVVLRGIVAKIKSSAAFEEEQRFSAQKRFRKGVEKQR